MKKKIDRRATLLLILTAAMLSGCASTKETTDDRPRDRITRQEIMDSGATNLFDAISRLRPQWLNVRTTRSFNMDTEIVVFQNDMQLGGPETLRQIGPELAYELRYMDGVRAATALPGLMSGRHIAGVIIIDTRPSSGG
jgi:hypothetical protein